VNRLVGITLTVGILQAGVLPAAAADESAKLAKDGFLLAKKYCYRCHNGSIEFDITDRDGLLAKKGDSVYVVPGQLDDSYLWQRIDDGDMPPEGQPQPSAVEKELLKQWIDAGAPKPEREKRPFKREEDVQADILNDLRGTKASDRTFQRYFTITHLYNNNENVSAVDLRLYRAAFAKAVNHLSWESRIVVPTAIDREQTVFRLDLRDLGWDKRNIWQSVLAVYPYGLKFNRVEDPQIREIDRQLELLSGTPLAYVRADWLSVTATRPPLYHVILAIPTTDRELEKQLNVDVQRDFLRNRLRLLDRHQSAYSYYWKSYDFAQNNKNGNLFRFPLGPKFKANPFNRQAFEHDGGEIIFTLPNRLQGFMLVDAKGKRIDEGPINVVRDLKETSGSPVVVNGLSCIHCHQHGMIRFKDTVRSGLAVAGEPREKARELFVSKDVMDRTVERDQRMFLEAVEQTTGSFLQTGEDKDKPIKDFAEPIGAIARFHYRDLGAEEAAYELGIESPEELKTAVKFNPHLKRLGLGPLLDGNKIERTEWESREFVTSPFQETARVLDRGTPYINLGGN
jgi:serine/threonine-protein kinase